jgi:hypothetical protein
VSSLVLDPSTPVRRSRGRFAAGLGVVLALSLAVAVAVVTFFDAAARAVALRAVVADGAPLYPVACVDCAPMVPAVVDWRVGLVWLLIALVAAAAALITRRHLTDR